MPHDHDLDRLNDAERAILALLAQGHTAKSIAAETGRTEGAVNERLREARRKTGVGSSRELARLVYARENRDEEIGMADEPAPGPAPMGAAPRPRWPGVLLMTIIFAALVAVALQLNAPPERKPATLFEAAAGRHYGDAVSWHEETRVQPRNAEWADSHEAVLRRRYAAIRGVDMASLQVTCRESKCEVVGRSEAGASAATLKRAMDELESPAMRTSLSAYGLHADYTNCGGQDTSREISFLAYWVSPED